VGLCCPYQPDRQRHHQTDAASATISNPAALEKQPGVRRPVQDDLDAPRAVFLKKPICGDLHNAVY
jgi:hypothetical protein